MKRALEVMKQKSDEHLETKNKMETIKRHLKEKDEQIEDLETSNQALMLHIELQNHKLTETRKELIEVSLFPFNIYIICYIVNNA